MGENTKHLQFSYELKYCETWIPEIFIKSKLTGTYMRK